MQQRKPKIIKVRDFRETIFKSIRFSDLEENQTVKNLQQLVARAFNRRVGDIARISMIDNDNSMIEISEDWAVESVIEDFNNLTVSFYEK